MLLPYDQWQQILTSLGFWTQENQLQICSNELKTKNISIMEVGTIVALLELYRNVYIFVQFYSFFPVFPYQSI